MFSLCDISNIVGKVVDDISSATIEGVKREFLYMYKYKDNVIALKDKMEELGDQEKEIKRKVERDEDDGKTIKDRVLKWQKDVQQIKDEVEFFFKMYETKSSCRCLKVLRFPNLHSHFQMGKEAVKKTKKVIELTVHGKEFVDGEISYRPRLVYANLPNTTSFDNDYVSFKSREDAYKKILEALNNEDAGFVVGVYGMAGVGKTRMMEEAWKQARKDGIFDEVARADVSSEKLDVRKLQGQLASHLNLHLPSEEDEELRASRLANRLTQKGNKILVLFDDVWEELPLNKIGVPFVNGRSKGCKILLTSRKRDVCFKNNCEDPIEIKVLKEEEGWGLFKKNVGNSYINSLNDESLAKKVCDECACLPLVIAAVGKALKGKPHASWKDALDQLQDSKLEKIDGIDQKVYTGLKLSFNHLQKDAKSCLFLCSVFPEDAVILIDELARLVKANMLIENLRTLETARTRVWSMVVALRDSSLLLPYDDDHHDTKVKLHDIIRDVAKSVAAKDPEYAFLEESYGTDWPKVGYKDRKLISLSFDGINYFPRKDDLACPELHTLVLNLKPDGECQQFPDWFFSGFPKLRVLVLNVRSNSHLSSSLQSLTNLGMLSLHNADLNISLIKELKNLEMLIILDNDIKELSLELRELKRLRLLDMSRNYCQNMIMSRHLLSSLSNLEELYIPRGFSPRGKEEEEGGGGGNPNTNPIHYELSKLTNLTTLHICLPDVTSLPNEEICQKLLRYVIDITPDERFARFDSIEEKRALRLYKVAMQGGRSSSLEILLKNVEYMELVRVNGFQTYFNHGVGEAFANLAKLSIRECDDLEHLGIRFPHNQPMKSFSKLTKLHIENSGFKYLFCPSSARRLVQLRTLEIYNCPMMEEIIRPREQEEEKEEEIIEFPNLKDMNLEHLPRLKSFFYCKKINMWSATPDQNTSTFPIHSLFNGMVSFPRLEELFVIRISSDVSDLVEVMGLNANLPREHKIYHLLCFRGLKMLFVKNCNGLSTLFTCSLAKTNLQQLEELYVVECEKMEEIVRDENEGNNKKMVATDVTNAHAAAHADGDEILFCDFPRLKIIDLRGLRVLKSYCGSARYTFHMPSLETVYLFYCPLMRDFTCRQLTTPPSSDYMMGMIGMV